MAEKAVAIADRLFRELLVPLVVGGELRPGRPIGGKNALALGPFSDVLDQELLSHVNLARVRVARRLLPLDHGGHGDRDAPTPAEWALAAMLHDIVQCAHPELTGMFRGRAPSRLLQLVELTAARVAEPLDVGEAVSRHTWFSRAFEITRVDSTVSFWVGKRTFLGKEPPSRLLAWPELRRVHVDKTPRALVDLPTAGGHVLLGEFEAGMNAWIRKTPLTDLATCTRALPRFQWSKESLAFISTRGGRTVALRALEGAVALDVDVALGRATKTLIDARSHTALAVVTALLGERALAAAMERAERATPETDAPPEEAMIARAVGAFGATQILAANEQALTPELARAVRWQLHPWLQTPAAQTTKALLGG